MGVSVSILVQLEEVRQFLAKTTTQVRTRWHSTTTSIRYHEAANAAKLTADMHEGHAQVYDALCCRRDRLVHLVFGRPSVQDSVLVTAVGFLLALELF